MEGNFKRKVRDCREWLSGAEGMVQLRVDKLHSQLNERSFDGLLRSTVGLSYMSIYYGARGVVKIADGGSAREDIGLSILYRFWEIKVRVASAKKRGFLGSNLKGAGLVNHASIAACTLFALAVLGDKNRALFVAEELRFILDEEIRDGGLEPPVRFFERFALFFAGRICTETVNPTVSGSDISIFGLYGDVVSSWGGEVGVHLPAIIEYHYGNCEYDRDGGTSTFGWCPFDAIPFEAIAVANHGGGIDNINSVFPSLANIYLSLHGGGAALRPDSTIDAVEASFREVFMLS